jgi:hypothetical protein
MSERLSLGDWTDRSLLRIVEAMVEKDDKIPKPGSPPEITKTLPAIPKDEQAKKSPEN